MPTKPLLCSPHKQQGLVIVMLGLVLVILLGMAALALDLGRLYVLKTEMQNAVDAAALAAAAELNAKDDAIERAKVAAKEVLKHDSHFSVVKELLEGIAVDVDMEFYCAIGRDEDADAGSEACPGDEDDNKVALSPPGTDEQAHYVRVTLNPDTEGNEDRYGIDLYFLPVLRIFGVDAALHAVTAVTALAGRHFYMCHYPPVMLCDPFEHSGGFRANVDVGDQILLKLQGGPNSKWSPGMFGFLDYDLEPAGGANQLAPFLANEGNMDCTPPKVMAETGQMATPMCEAMNTRFDQYGHPPFNKPSAYVDYPPAPNITDYGGYYDDTHLNECPPAGFCADNTNITSPVCWRDSVLQCPGGETRIGSGDWSRQGYWQAKHPPDLAPTDLETMTRYELYMHELDNDASLSFDEPDSTHVTSGTLPERRVIYVAVLACDALDVEPNEVVPIIEPESGFAKMFITESCVGSPATNFFVEFMGWATDKDENYHVTVQLYE